MPHGGHAVAQSQYYAIKRGFVLGALGIRFDSALVVAAIVAVMVVAAMVAVLLHHLLVYQAGDRVLLRATAAHRAMDVEIPRPAIPKCALLTLLIST